MGTSMTGVRVVCSTHSVRVGAPARPFLRHVQSNRSYEPNDLRENHLRFANGAGADFCLPYLCAILDNPSGFELYGPQIALNWRSRFFRMNAGCPYGPYK